MKVNELVLNFPTTKSVVAVVRAMMGSNKKQKNKEKEREKAQPVSVNSE